MSDKKNRHRCGKASKLKWCVIGILMAVLICGGLTMLRERDAEEVLNQGTETQQLETDPSAKGEQTEETSGEEIRPVDTFIIDTAVCQLQFPDMYQEYLRHTEVSQGETVTEIFEMLHGEFRVELFRVYFDMEQVDNAIGYIKTEDGNWYISIDAGAYSRERFENPEIQECYEKLLGGLDIVVDSIQSNSQFRKLDEVEIVVAEQKLNYWSFSLPENIQCEEMLDNGGYLVTFYGNVNDQRVKLYAVRVGIPELKNPIGFYTIDEKINPVSIESYELPSTDGWSEGNITELYIMMDSINTMIDVVISDEHYSSESPAG